MTSTSVLVSSGLLFSCPRVPVPIPPAGFGHRLHTLILSLFSPFSACVWDCVSLLRSARCLRTGRRPACVAVTLVAFVFVNYVRVSGHSRASLAALVALFVGGHPVCLRVCHRALASRVSLTFLFRHCQIYVSRDFLRSLSIIMIFEPDVLSDFAIFSRFFAIAQHLLASFNSAAIKLGTSFKSCFCRFSRYTFSLSVCFLMIDLHVLPSV